MHITPKLKRLIIFIIFCSAFAYFLPFIFAAFLAFQKDQTIIGKAKFKVEMQLLTTEGWIISNKTPYLRVVRSIKTGCQYYHYIKYLAPRYGRDGKVMGCGETDKGTKQ